THIRQSLLAKQPIIEADEYERDLRKILNYGHTFGHALEAITNFEVPHGMAVAWGMDLVNFISWRRGILEDAWYHQLHAFNQRFFDVPAARRVSAAELIAATRRDKKVVAGKLTLILLRRPSELGQY